MNDFDYSLNESWDLDVEHDTFMPEEVASYTSQRIPSTGLLSQRHYQPRRREASLHHPPQPWVVPSSGYSPRRQHVLNNRRMRQASTTPRAAPAASRAPVDGLMIHVEKRVRNGGLVAQIPLPSTQAPQTSPLSRRSTTYTNISRASSQSVAQDDGASAAASNGPITPAISPIYGSSPETVKPLISDSFIGMEQRLQNSLAESAMVQPYYDQSFPYMDGRGCVWNASGTFPQHTASYNFYNFPSEYPISQQEPLLYSTDATTYVDDEYLSCRRNFTVPEQLHSSTSKKPVRKHFTPEVTSILKTWFKENLPRPYPSEETKQDLLRQTGLTMNQLSNWFINARRRNWRKSRHAKDA